MKIVLHIGLPKTGSSSFQNWASARSSELEKLGIGFLPTIMAGHRIAAEYISDPRRIIDRDVGSIYHSCNLQNAKAILLKMAANPDLHTILISSEYFYISDPIRVSAFFARMNMSITQIIAVIRRQDSLITSGYNQDVKALGESSPYEFKGFEDKYDFSLLANSWQNTMDTPDIRFHNFDHLVSKKRIVAAIAEDIGAGSALQPNDHTDFHFNDSLSAELLEIVRTANALGLNGIGEIAVTAQQHGISGSHFSLPHDVRVEITNTYRESNNRLVARFGSDFESFLNTEDTESVSISAFPVIHALKLLAFAAQGTIS